MPKRIAILGASGTVGTALAAHILRAKLLEPADQLLLVGRGVLATERKLLGIRTDLIDAFDDERVRIEVVSDVCEVEADIVVVAAGVTASYATQTRRDLGVANRGIFEHLAEQCILRLAQALFIVVSNPVELAVKIFSLAFHSAPQLLRRDDDLQQLCPDGVALATVCSARVGLGTICREHGSQGSQHVAVPRMETVQETLLVAVATG